jgi:hypothetical protein
LSSGDNNQENRGTIISTQVISASLTMITVSGAFAVFIIDKRDIGIGYYVIAGLSFLFFVISIFLGGQGLNGKGKNESPNPYFNWQAITSLLGIILFCISVFLGKEKPNELEKKVNEQEKYIIELKIRDEDKAKEIQQLNDKIDKLIQPTK